MTGRLMAVIRPRQPGVTGVIDHRKNPMSAGNDSASYLKTISGISDTFKRQGLMLQIFPALTQISTTTH